METVFVAMQGICMGGGGHVINVKLAFQGRTTSDTILEHAITKQLVSEQPFQTFREEEVRLRGDNEQNQQLQMGLERSTLSWLMATLVRV
jgi:hypothetical protein